jgi:hypothetical protein
MSRPNCWCNSFEPTLTAVHSTAVGQVSPCLAKEPRHGAIVLIRGGGFEQVARGKPAKRRVENNQVEHAVDIAEDIAAADFDAVCDTVAQGVVAGGREGVRG